MGLSFNDEQYNILLQSLEYTKSAFNKTSYPTYEMKRERLDSVQEIISMLREERKRGKDD